MNWLEGNTDYYSSEYLTGMEMAYPERWKKLIGEKNSAALIRRRPAFGRPVVIISGGGCQWPAIPWLCRGGACGCCRSGRGILRAQCLRHI